MKKRFITMALISALMLSAASCAKEPAATTTTAPVYVAEEELETATTTAAISEEETTPEETETTKPSAPTGVAGDNIYNSTAPTNLSDDVTFSITVEYINDEPYVYEGGAIKYDRNNAVDVTTETFNLDKGMTLKMLSDKLATFGGLVKTEATLSYSTDEEYKFAYTGFGYNLGISDDEFVDLYIEFEDESGNIIEDISMVDDNSVVKAIAVYEEDVENITGVSSEKYSDSRSVLPINKTPLMVKFSIDKAENYEVFIGRGKRYLYDNNMGTLIHINNEKSYIANNTDYTLITCSDKTYDDYVNSVILVRN